MKTGIPNSREIERKFLVKSLPENLRRSRCYLIAQGYLASEPGGRHVDHLSRRTRPPPGFRPPSAPPAEPDRRHGAAGCHRRGPLEVSLRCQVATSLSWLHELHPKRCVRTHNMIVRSPPLQMAQQLWRLLGRGPGTTSQRGYCMSDGQWSPFNERCVQPSREASSL